MHATNYDKLRQRGEQVKCTLAFIRAERLAVQRNAQDMDPEAFRCRMRLYDHLIEGYNEETAEIEKCLAEGERREIRRAEPASRHLRFTLRPH